MSTQLANIGGYSERADYYAKKSKARNTVRAYAAAVAEFGRFCQERGCKVENADGTPNDAGAVHAVVEYLTSLADAGQRVATIDVKKAGISAAFVMAGRQDPTKHADVKTRMGGIRRDLAQRGKATPQRKAPILFEDLCKMANTLDTRTIAGKRDRAILLFGWAGAFRRSELVALDIGDLRINGKIVVTLRQSKTDQEGQGLQTFIEALPGHEFCPVAAMHEYLNAAGLGAGPVFLKCNRNGAVIPGKRLTSQHIALLVKRTAQAAGLDWRSFSGHSLRAGFVTQAHINHAENSDIRAQTHHKSDDTLQKYIRDAGQGAGRAMLAAFGQ